MDVHIIAGQKPNLIILRQVSADIIKIGTV